jgi:hypothetical protein
MEMAGALGPLSTDSIARRPGFLSPHQDWNHDTTMRQRMAGEHNAIMKLAAVNNSLFVLALPPLNKNGDDGDDAAAAAAAGAMMNHLFGARRWSKQNHGPRTGPTPHQLSPADQMTFKLSRGAVPYKCTAAKGVLAVTLLIGRWKDREGKKLG